MNIDKIVGFNYRFGYKNMGNIELLKELSVKYKFSLDIIKPVKFNDNIISSTIIRNLIADQGDVKQAANMLSRPYMLQGKIIPVNTKNTAKINVYIWNILGNTFLLQKGKIELFVVE